jgi:hypothetical protein
LGLYLLLGWYQKSFDPFGLLKLEPENMDNAESQKGPKKVGWSSTQK